MGVFFTLAWLEHFADMHAIEHNYIRVPCVFPIRAILYMFPCLNECVAVNIDVTNNHCLNLLLNSSAKKYLWTSQSQYYVFVIQQSDKVWPSCIAKISECEYFKMLKKNHHYAHFNLYMSVFSCFSFLMLSVILYC